MSLLGPAPARLAPAPRAFLAQLADAVEALRPPLLDGQRTAVHADGTGVEVLLAHARVPGWAIHARIGATRGTVAIDLAREEFAASAAFGRWWDAPVVLIGRLLCGELELEVGRRGAAVVEVALGGRRRRVARPGALALWRPLRVEVQRPDFGARR